MKPLPFLLFSLISQSFVVSAFAQTLSPAFMTSRDAMHSTSPSNIYLHNSGDTAVTVYGLYIHQFGSVIPGDTCDDSELIYSGDSNITAGSFVMPTLIPAGKYATISQNYLYNMILEANYYVRISIPSSPPGCALPGCTWGSDSTIYNWCIYLGALSPVFATEQYPSNVPPSTASAAGEGYDYNLIDSYVTLGPISCNDQTLTCTVANQQTQSFP